MPTIAVVTSITFGGDLRASFDAGLNASGVGAVNIVNNWEAEGHYDNLPQNVRNAASTHPDLIVAAGGLPTANAAATVLVQANGDPQFVYLAGAPRTVAANPCESGFVNQNVTGENQERKEKLTDPPFNVDPARIWLVVNNNNPFSAIETNAWGNLNYRQFFQGMANPPNNTDDTSNNNHFMAEFQALAAKNPPPLGLVVSPDPYFRRWRTALTIALANKLPVPVCYPYKDFVDAANQTGNAGKSRALDRPILARASGDGHIAETAYYQLGYKAGRYLIQKAAGHPHYDAGVTRWDAASHSWT